MIFPVEKDNPVSIIPWLIYLLITVNVIIFLVANHHLDLRESIKAYGFISSQPSIETALTSMFMHGGYLHIIGNMLFLYIFGDNVEDALGRVEFLCSYILCGLASVITYWALNQQPQIPLVGASGAISGVLGIYMVLFPHTHVDLVAYGQHGQRALLAHISAKGAVLIWLAVQATLGLLFMSKSGGIAFSAHVGGLLFGILVGYFFKEKLGYEPKKPEKELCFERDKITDIWCPHCGQNESSTNFGAYECSACGTKYRIEKSEYYSEPVKEYTEKSIDLDSLAVLEQNEIPSGGKSAHIYTDEKGKNIKYSAYLQSEKAEQTITIVIHYEGITRLLERNTFTTEIELSDYLRSDTKFVLCDFK